MAYKYALTGPPFNFSGNLSETQRDAFISWVDKQATTLSGVQTAHQMRAQSLRKTAGLLEKFYATSSQSSPDVLTPSFIKATWKPESTGHFAYAYRQDHVPAVTVDTMKQPFQSRLVKQDDAVFHMNFIRTMVERREDLAQYAHEAITETPKLVNKLNQLFGKPEYQATLAKDKTDLYQGQPRFRVNQFDPPTPWELATRSGNSPVGS